MFLYFQLSPKNIVNFEEQKYIEAKKSWSSLVQPYPVCYIKFVLTFIFCHNPHLAQDAAGIIAKIRYRKTNGSSNNTAFYTQAVASFHYHNYWRWCMIYGYIHLNYESSNFSCNNKYLCDHWLQLSKLIFHSSTSTLPRQIPYRSPGTTFISGKLRDRKLYIRVTSLIVSTFQLVTSHDGGKGLCVQYVRIKASKHQ